MNLQFFSQNLQRKCKDPQQVFEDGSPNPIQIRIHSLQMQQEFFQIRSIEEYRNKNFRYQITEEGVLVEEMVYQLLNQKHAARGALDEEVFR